MLSCPSCSFSNNEQARLCGYCGLYLKAIGDYVLQEQIGVGGFAEVYRAVNRYTGHPAAIKFLHRKLINDKEVEQRFLREVEILRDLHSPNIVQIYDFGVLEDIGLYLVMEWIDGETLDNYIQQQPKQRLQQKEAIKLFSQLLYGLSRIHEQRVVHRDLKPKNFMIVQEQGQSVLKILDFGIAWVAGRQALTERGMFVGSTYFMAPEQFRAQKDLFGPSTDLYVAGLLLAWMLTGKHVFTGTSIKELAVQHCYNMPPMLSELCPEEEFLPALEAVVTYSLQKEPHRRFQSAMEFLEALNNPLTFQRQFLQNNRSLGPDSPSTVALHPASDQLLPETGKRPVSQTRSYRMSPDSQVVRHRSNVPSPQSGALHQLQNKRTQPLNQFSDAAYKMERPHAEHTGRLAGTAAGLGGNTSLYGRDNRGAVKYSEEQTHADVLVQEKPNGLLQDKTDLQQTPASALPSPSSPPPDGVRNSGPSSPPIEVEEMRGLSELIASWPTKIEAQPELYRPLSIPAEKPKPTPDNRTWLWVALFLTTSVVSLGWYLFQQSRKQAQQDPQLTTQLPKESLPLRSIHDDSKKKPVVRPKVTTPPPETRPPSRREAPKSERSTKSQKTQKVKRVRKPSRTTSRRKKRRAVKKQRRRKRSRRRYARR